VILSGIEVDLEADIKVGGWESYFAAYTK
jgi:hypothetical protein